MAWTTPASWSVAELVAASKMNTHIRDNLNYLKGAAGAITLDSNLGIGGAPSYTVHAQHATSARVAAEVSSASGASILQTIAPNVNCALQSIGASVAGSYISGLNNAGLNVIQFAGSSTANGAIGTLVNAPIHLFTNSALRLSITGGGDVGIGTASPQGRLHGYNSVSGFLHWEHASVDGTLRTILPAASFSHGVTWMYFIRENSAPGTSITGSIRNDGLSAGTSFVLNGSTLAILTTAGGGMTAQRTAGSGSFKVALWVLYM